jgi:hypothetical protein
MEIYIEVYQKIKNRYTMVNLLYHSLAYIQRSLSQHTRDTVHIHVNCSTIHIHQSMESA